MEHKRLRVGTSLKKHRNPGLKKWAKPHSVGFSPNARMARMTARRKNVDPPVSSNLNGVAHTGLQSHSKRYYLKDAVLDGGIPFSKAYGMTAFEYYGEDPRFKKLFNEGMRSHSTIITKKLLEMYTGFSGLKFLVDVAGGVGGTIGMIIKKYPHIKGINFDLPHVISEAPVIPGVEHIDGDMFESVPSGDAILMKWILHDWSDEHCAEILKNCWKALPVNGRVILMEGILPVNPEPTPMAQVMFYSDMLMLAYNPGGKERTEKEFDSLAKGAGFLASKVVCGYANSWVIELYK